MFLVAYFTLGIGGCIIGAHILPPNPDLRFGLGALWILFSFFGSLAFLMWRDPHVSRRQAEAKELRDSFSHPQFSSFYGLLTFSNVPEERKTDFLTRSATLVSMDEYGTLYEVREGSFRFLVVAVKNSTPDASGRQKLSFLPVDIECRPLLANGGKGDAQARTARNAVASTFGLYGEDYRPVIET